MIPPFIRVTIITLLCASLSIAQTKHQLPVEANYFSIAMSNTDWSSKYADWHSRAKPHPDPSSFRPTRSALSLAVLRNAPVEPEGFTLALFDKDADSASSTRASSPTSKAGIAVDAMGRVFEVAADDYEGIVSLGRRILELPPTDTFRNTWVLKRETTCQPIDRILVAVKGGSEEQVELKETSVQGFAKDKTMELKRPVGEGEITHLPPVLSELVGLVLEGRADYTPGKGNRKIVSDVKDILGDVF